MLDEINIGFPLFASQEIRYVLSHRYTELVFKDLFFPETPAYAIPGSVISSIKSGHISNSENLDFEILRKVRSASLITEECKATTFLSSFIAETVNAWTESHIIYRALKIGDEIMKQVIDLSLSKECLQNVLKSSLLGRPGCSACSGDNSSEAPRTCTSLCENVINGCYFIMARLFAEEHEAFSVELSRVLRNRAERERAYERKKIVRPLTEQDLQDVMLCSGMSRHEVYYRISRLVRIAPVGREHHYSREFKHLLRVPETTLMDIQQLSPDAYVLCRNGGWLEGNSGCYNGDSVGSYNEGTYPFTADGQEENPFSSFESDYEMYNELSELRGQLQDVTDELKTL